MRLFATPRAIIDEIAAMKIAEKNRRDDRATIREFYNGKPPLTDEQAKDIGLNINVNNLYGYTDLADAKAQLLGLYTKPIYIYTVEIDAMPQHREYERQVWEAELTAAFNELIKDSGKFKPSYEGIAGDVALHGEAVFAMPNATFWCPKQLALSKLLVSDDAPTDVDLLTHWAVEGEIPLRDLHRYASGNLPNWKGGEVKKILTRIYKDVPAASTETWDANNAERWEEIRQRNPVNGNGRRLPAVKVIYFYQVECDKPGAPVALTIILDDSEAVEPSEQTNEEVPESRVLFDASAYFPSTRDVISPVFMDCTLGGETKWHGVLGTGTLNYGLNQAIEVLVNRVHQGTYEGMMNLWQAGDTFDREQVQEILMRHNGVVPEGVNLINQRLPVNIADAINMVQFFRQQGQRNSRKATENGANQNLLEVQAMLANSQTEDVSSSRTANWYDYQDRLGKVMLSRLVNPCLLEWQDGYSDAIKLQARLQRKNIPLRYVQPHNLLVRATRILGDGSSKREKESAIWLTQNRAMFPPQAQQRITRMATAAMTGSYRIAEELVPIDPEPDTTQMIRAETENNTAIIQGRPMPVNDTDVDDEHFPIHLEAMIALVNRVAQDQNATFEPTDYRAFTALGTHAVAHIHKIQSMVPTGQGDKENKRKASMWMQALNQVVALGEKMLHNMQQKQQGDQGEKPDPIEVARLQLDAHQLQLQNRKQDFNEQKFQRTQLHRESDSAFRRMLELTKNDREDQKTKSALATNDVQTALDVKAAHEPAKASA